MARNETFFLDGPAGRLEALLQHPEGPPKGTALVCHAHPLQGGIMHFKLLFRAAKVLQEAGYACLRFNFRGVGGSAGTHDHGIGEQDDVRAALGELDRRFPGLPRVLGGFSFGSVMALEVGARLPGLQGLFGLGFPVRTVADPGFLTRIEAPLLMVQGEHDAFGRGEDLRNLLSELKIRANLEIVPGADHFFTGVEERAMEALRAWTAALPRP
jgi:alpha/beta superfamily hydrolase